MNERQFCYNKYHFAIFVIHRWEWDHIGGATKGQAEMDGLGCYSYISWKGPKKPPQGAGRRRVLIRNKTSCLKISYFWLFKVWIFFRAVEFVADEQCCLGLDQRISHLFLPVKFFFSVSYISHISSYWKILYLLTWSYIFILMALQIKGSYIFIPMAPLSSY